jgi:hypothetical protein
MPESFREFSMTLSLCSFNCKLAASSSCCWILILSIALTSPPFSFDTGKQVPIPKMQICLSQWGKLFCFGFRCTTIFFTFDLSHLVASQLSSKEIITLLKKKTDQNFQ